MMGALASALAVKGDVYGRNTFSADALTATHAGEGRSEHLLCVWLTSVEREKNKTKQNRNNTVSM